MLNVCFRCQSRHSGERNCTKLGYLPVDGESSHTDHRDVEKMTITINSVVERDSRYAARACATAQDAKISLEVSFAADRRSSSLELRDRARDEVLRYLDPA